MIYADLHVHPSPWRFGQSAYRSFARTAIARGVDILGFAEHGPPCDPDPRYCGLDEKEIESYISSVETTKSELGGQIQIFCGLELDYHPPFLDLYRRLKAEYPFDYFLASVHIIDDWHLDTPDSLSASVHRHKTEEDLYRLYYSTVMEAAQTDLFDGFAHLDYIRRSLPHLPGEPPAFSREIFEEAAYQLAAKDVAVEINTRGLSIRAIQEVYPTRPLLKTLARTGVRFMAGSDAHEVDRLGDGFNVVRHILAEEGRGHTTYFKGKQPFEAEI